MLLLVVLFLIHTQPGGVIAGRVTYADTGDGAPQTSIRCVARDGDRGITVTSNSEGRFECPLPAGIYIIRAELPSEERRYLSLPHGAKTVFDDGRGVRLHANERLEIALTLVRRGSISGRVTDPDGVPLADAIVTASALPDDDNGIEIDADTRAATTGNDGMFNIVGLTPGAYRVYVDRYRRPGSSPVAKDGTELVRTWIPGTTDARQAIAVQVGGQELAAVDLIMQRGKPAHVRGRVLRADGTIAPGVNVGLMVRRGRSLYAWGAVTDAKGFFRIDRVPPGSYDITVKSSLEFPERVYETITVGDSGPYDVTLLLRGTTYVKGRVRFEGGEFPRGTLNVYARATDPAVPISQASIDDDNVFELQNTVGGLRVIRVTPLPKGWWLKSVASAGRDITNHALDLTDG
ncbi:MAG TPA: carboxypeptidase-like regulatory domain-containing protein, partial [Vicinamibacterales bacterium]